MSIMTSLHPDVHKVRQGGKDDPGTRLDPAIITLAEILKKAGYATAGFTGGGHVSAKYGFDKGFDVYQEGSIRNVLFWLNSNHERKFFLFFHTYATHDPYFPPKPYSRMYDKSYAGKIFDSRQKLCPQASSKYDVLDNQQDIFWASVNKEDPRDIDFLVAQYDAAINFVDNEMIRRLVEKLRELGIYDNTLMILTSDHGEAFKEHNNFLHTDLYTEVLRVPLIIAYPKVIPKNRVVKQLVRLTDIMPTVLDISGLKTNTRIQGKSLLPAIVKNRFLGLSCYSNSCFFNIKAIRTAGYAFIETTGNDGKDIHKSLFNRQTDPAEKDDIAASRPDVAYRLERQLHEQMNNCNRFPVQYKQIEAAPFDSETLKKLKSLGYMQ